MTVWDWVLTIIAALAALPFLIPLIVVAVYFVVCVILVIPAGLCTVYEAAKEAWDERNDDHP